MLGKDVLLLKAHPDFGLPGMSLKIRGTRAEGYSALSQPLDQFTMEYYGALEIGKPGFMPCLLLYAFVDWRSESGTTMVPSKLSFEVKTNRAWVPFDVVPWFVLPAVGGRFDLDDQGIVEIRIWHEPVTLRLPGNLLNLIDWQASLRQLRFSIGEVDMEPELKLHVSGGLLIAPQVYGGFLANISGSLETQISSYDSHCLSLLVTHSGGWRPFGHDIEVITPPMLGFMTFNASGLAMSVGAQIPGVVELPGLRLSRGSDEALRRLRLDPEAMRDVLVGAGPLIMLQLNMPKDSRGEYLDPQIMPVVAASVCVDLEGKDEPPKCGDFRMGQGEVAGKYSMDLTFDKAVPNGGFAPLRPIAKYVSMPYHVETAVVVLMDEEYPLIIEFELDVDTMRELSFSFQGAVLLKLKKTLGINAVLDIGASGKVTDTGDFEGAFAISMPELFIEALNLTMSGPAVTIATDSGFTQRISGEMVETRKGFAIRFKGPVPDWGLCSDKHGRPKILVEMWVESLTKIGGAFGCTLDWVVDLRGWSEEEASGFDSRWLGGVNLIRMSGLSIEFSASWGVATRISLQVGATFEMSTRNSTCDATAAEVTNPQCLLSEFTIMAGVTINPAVPPGYGVVLELMMVTEGVWFDPLNLRNIAVMDPGIGLGLKITPYGPPTGVIVTPTKIFLNLNVYWKKSGDWPAELKSKEHAWPAPMAELLTAEDSQFDIVGAQATVLYEEAPHDDDALNRLSLPKVGVLLGIYNFVLVDAPILLCDMAYAVLWPLEAELNLPYPDCEDFRLPSWVAKLFPFQMSFQLEFSLMNKPEPFQRRLFIDAEIKGVNLKQLVTITALLVPAAAGPALGVLPLLPDMWFDLAVKTDIKLPPMSEAGLTSVFADPLSYIKDAGIGLACTLKFFGTLDEPMFLLGFKGWVGIDSFYIGMRSKMNFLGFSFDINMYLELSITTLSFRLGGSLLVGIPYFGIVHLSGEFGMMSPTAPEMGGNGPEMGGNGDITENIWIDVNGTIDVALFDFCIVGTLNASSRENRFAAKLTAYLGIFGNYHFSGDISAEGYYLEGRLGNSFALGAAADNTSDPFVGSREGLIRILIDGINWLCTEILGLGEAVDGEDNFVVDILRSMLIEFEIKDAYLKLDSDDGFEGAVSILLAGEIHNHSFSIANPFGDNGALGLGRRRQLESHDPPPEPSLLIPGTTKRRAIYSAGFLEDAGHHDAHGKLKTPRRLQKRTNRCGGYGGDNVPTPWESVESFVDYWIGDFIRGLLNPNEFVKRIYDLIGPVDYSLEENLNLAEVGMPTVNLGITVRFRLSDAPLSANISFLGEFDWTPEGDEVIQTTIKLRGGGTLGNTKAILSGFFEGEGQIVMPWCDAFPVIYGRLTMEKAGILTPFLVTMETSFEFLYIRVEGSASFSEYGGLRSFRFMADATDLCEQFKNAVSRALTGKDISQTDDLFVAGLAEVLGWFELGKLLIYNPAYTIWVRFQFSATLFGLEIDLDFRFPRFPTTFGDFVEIIAELAKDVLRSLAPVDYTITLIGDPEWKGEICFPRICTCELDCSANFERSRSLREIGDTTGSLDGPSVQPPQDSQNHSRSTTRVQTHRPQLSQTTTERRQMTGAWTQVKPGGRKYPLEKSDGQMHIAGMTFSEYQHARNEELRSSTGTPSPRSLHRPTLATSNRTTQPSADGAINAFVAGHHLLRGKEENTWQKTWPDKHRSSGRGHGHDGRLLAHQQELSAPSPQHWRDCDPTGCCWQWCPFRSPLVIYSTARVMINETWAFLQIDTHFLLQLNVLNLPGNWPEYDDYFTIRIDFNMNANSRSLCDLVPQVGHLMRNTCIGGDEVCVDENGIQQCTTLGGICLEDVISCEMLTL
jgi:hypothetical protein